MKIYLVGGAVRDKLLNYPSNENDWVIVGATPEDMIAEGFKAVGKDFPVFIHPQSGEEYALARTERKVSRGYTGFEFYTAKTVTLEEDLQRRDLTINAMAMTASDDLIDPYGGQHDLANKLLRHVSPAFAEDPVRILRVARFYARFFHRGFSIAPETIKLMRQMVQNGEVDALVPERVWQELTKALREINPEKFFEALRLCGALQRLMPEVDQLYGVPNKPAYHPEIDSGVHTMMVLQQAVLLTADPETRFAALCHDFGKGVTPMTIWPSHHGHEEVGVPLIKNFCMRFNIPKGFRDLALITAQYHAQCHRVAELRAGTILELFEKTDALRRPQRFQQFLHACEADFRGRPGFETKAYSQQEILFKLLNVLQQVDIKQLLEKKYQGEQLVQAIRQLRISAIRAVTTKTQRRKDAKKE